jgi:hypothetical protein
MENTMKPAGTVRSDRRLVEQGMMDIRLQAHEIYRIDSKHGAKVQALKGVLWVTQKGDVEDHILKPGEQFFTLNKGLILVEGMDNAEFRLVI